MNKTHPSRWVIRHDPNNGRMFCLPLGGKEYIRIGTKSFGAIYRHAKVLTPKTLLAGDFARALNEIKQNDVDLSNVKFVSDQASVEVWIWLDRFETLVMQHNQAVNAEQRPQKPVSAPVAPVDQKTTDRMAIAELRLEIAKEALSALIAKHDSDLIDQGKLASKAFAYADEMIVRFENYL